MYSWRKCFRMIRLAILVCALFFMAMDALSSKNFTPPHQGDLTVAEFAENYNHQAAVIGQGCGRLDENGQLPGDQMMLVAQKREAPYYWEDVVFSYELEGEYVKAVTITGHLAICPPQYWDGRGRPDNLPATRAATGALAWAREDAPAMNLMRQLRLSRLKGRALTDYDTRIADVEISNRAFSADGKGQYDMIFTLRLAD